MPLTKRQKQFACATGICMLMQYEWSKRHWSRRWWVKPWRSDNRRAAQGAGANLLQEVRETDPESYKNFHRMEENVFDELLEKVEPYVARQKTIMRDPLTVFDKVSLTLRFLASGASYKDLMYLYRISDSTISSIIPTVCDAIYHELKEDYAAIPETVNEWQAVADNFDELWQFPHCIGAIDGKHINIRAPPKSGSTYFNYKGHNSVVLLGLADARARILAFELGTPGSHSDGGIFKDSLLSSICESGNIPPPQKIGNQVLDIPYFFIGDEAFSLTPHMMKPYPHRSALGDEKVFNYRLSRARRIVENAFGIMCARFRILLRTMELKPENVVKVVRACIVLHNMLITKQDARYLPAGFMDTEDGQGQVTQGTWRELVEGDISNLAGDASVRTHTHIARDVRDVLKEYFYCEGAIPFQWAMTD